MATPTLVEFKQPPMKKSIILSFLFIALAFTTTQAQETYKELKNSISVSLATDTVTNTGTAVVQADMLSVHGHTTSVSFIATKLSGTVAGTVALHGSNNGTNFYSISSTTFTATDVASQGGTWQLTGCPFRFYRITWTGSGTMSATLAGNIYVNTNQ